jgi:HD-GYP domain-containing protein (c-di-GMP phosphodiesterase class II)
MDVRMEDRMDAELRSENLLERVEQKDPSTFRHSCRVAEMIREWAGHMHVRGFWGEWSVRQLELSGRIHDVGKIGVPDSILNKAGPLDSVERERMNAHAEEGYELVKHLPHVEFAALAVRHHHERWDGLGYPAGLKGEQIPFQARVVAIVDAFDAMTEDRVYRKGRSSGEALLELERCAGSHFCPSLVRDFIQFIHARNG